MVSQFLRRFPYLRESASLFSKPDIAKNCPDNLFDYVQALMPGLLVDNEKFTWEGHEYLIDPYKAIRFDGHRKEDGDAWVWMCGAQVGKSVAAMLLCQFLSLYFWGKYLGYFLPTADMAMIFSAERFKPMCMSIPQIAQIWGKDPTADEDDTVNKVDQKRVRSIGPSRIFFNSMAGKTSTESIPMLGLIFDEVRRMVDGDIERAQERISHSPYPLSFKISTAGYPDTNIDRAFRNSSMNKFHSFCKCQDGIALADVFPDCIGQKLPGVTPSLKALPEYFFVCPKCKEPIENPRNGKWISHNPGHKITGYHISQILSSRQTAAKIFDAFIRATDITEFYNSKLGIPHISKDALIVNPDVLKATVNPDLQWKKSGINTAMGVDQMLGLNVAVIREKGPKDPLTGLHKSRLIHLEWIAEEDPWPRLHVLMKQFDVSICVCDSLPNGNDALRFAKAFPGRVFLADYSFDGSGGSDIAVWGDRVKGDHNKKADKDTKEKHRVRISRFHGIEWNLNRYVSRIKEQPNEKGLVAEVPDLAGRPVTTWICEEVFWMHLQKIARRKVDIDEEQGRFKMVFENIGLDPHFVHADLYAELALSRLPDADRRAFSDFRHEAEAEDSDKAHHWKRMGSNSAHWRCEKCELAVAVTPGKTAQEIAEKRGFKDCNPEK